MLDRDKLTSHLHREEDSLLAGHILDKIEMVMKRKSTEATNFLDPYQREIASGIITQIYDVNSLEDGGYPRAERKRVVIFPEFLFPDHVETTTAILKIEGNFKFQAVSHRDFLGSLLGLGIKREMIGDILLTDQVTQVIVAREVKDFIVLKLQKVHQVPVTVTEMTADDLIIPPERTKTITTTVASMRLDAVAGSGFSDSRSKIAREIKNEKVKLNWKTESNPAQQVEVGDLISIRGRGRVKVDSREGLSHRGRIKLVLKKYI